MISQTIKDQLAPSGTLRVGINFGNPVLVRRDGATGEWSGVAVDLARELGCRFELPVELVGFEAAGKMSAALQSGAWDVAFLAAEPGRADEIAFTAPYLLIEGTYLIPHGSPIQNFDEVDRAGVRVGMSTGSAYELFLRRNMKHAQMVQAGSPSATFNLLIDGKADVLAGVRQTLVANSAKLPGARVFDESFMAIGQAIGMPHGRPAALLAVRQFIEEMKASGFVAKAIERAGVHGVPVAPSAAVSA